MSPLESLLHEAQQQLAAGRFDAAADAAKRALDLAPSNDAAARLWGVALRERECYQQSVEVLRRAAALHPQNAPIFCELGTTLAIMGQHQEAFRYLRQAGNLDPAMQVAFLNLGAVLYEQGHLAAALQVNERALLLKPACALAHYNKANALRELGRVAESLPEFDAALALQPDFPRAYYNQGLAHLLLGNFREGWLRFETREAAGEVVLDRYPQPRWDGSPLAGRRLLVQAEQGIGDEILFATCIPDLARQAPGLVLTCDPRLEPLFVRSFPGIHVVGHVRQRDCSPATLPVACDVQIPLGSLPFHLRPTWDSFPRTRQLLSVEPGLLATWQRRFAELGPGLKVGLSWRAGGHSLDRRKRTIPLADWREILSVPGVQFVNLQYSDSGEELEQIRRDLGIEIHDWEDADPLVDMDGFAAKIAALDLVISVGNATVHLAGAVGTPTWTLLPLVPSWRWMIAGDESPWYATVRLFRQASIGAWQPVLDRIRDLLGERAASGDPPVPTPAASAARIVSSKRKGAARATKPPVSPAPANTGEIKEPLAWLPPKDVLGRVTDELLTEPLARADRHREAGEFAEAEDGYREVLRVAPRHIQAHTGLGLVAMKTGRLELALRSFRRSLALAEDAFDAQYHVAAVLALSGRFEEAVRHYCRALELAPSFRPAHLELGLALQRLERHADALAPFRAAQSLAPLAFDAYFHEGQSLMLLHRSDEARERFLAAAQREPGSAAVWEYLGENYLQDQEYEAAEQCLRRSLARAGNQWSAWQHLGRLLVATGRPEEALEAYAAVLALDPRRSGACLEMAEVLESLGKWPEALALLEKTAQLLPQDPQVLHALGQVLARLDRTSEALDRYAQTIRQRPDFAAARFSRALALLRQGNLEQAWRDYESRWHLRDVARPRTFLRQPLWDGSPLSGRTILIHGEQSLGDEILFATCYPDVIEQAGHVIIVCSPKLAVIFRRSFPRATICAVARGREHVWPMPARRIDCQIPAGSLPRFLRSHAASFPRRGPLLTADPARLAIAQAWLAGLPAGRRVGFALGTWQGGTARRDPPAEWQPLLATPGMQFVDVERMQAGLEAPDSSLPGAIDLDAQAALIGGLDLVIAVDSPALHLAGGLGVATWALSPEAPLGTVWLADEHQRSLWYPNVRIFRPQRLGDRGELAKAVRRELLNDRPLIADRLPMGPFSGPHWSAAASTEQLH